jgi:hypothetical protein
MAQTTARRRHKRRGRRQRRRVAVASDTGGPSGAAPIREAPLRGGRRAGMDWELPGVEGLSRPIGAASPAIFGAAMILGCDCQRGQEAARNRHDSQRKPLRTRQARLALGSRPPSRLVLGQVAVHSPLTEAMWLLFLFLVCLPGPLVIQSRHSTDCESRTSIGRQRNARRLCHGHLGWRGAAGEILGLDHRDMGLG